VLTSMTLVFLEFRPRWEWLDQVLRESVAGWQCVIHLACWSEFGRAATSQDGILATQGAHVPSDHGQRHKLKSIGPKIDPCGTPNLLMLKGRNILP